MSQPDLNQLSKVILDAEDRRKINSDFPSIALPNDYTIHNLEYLMKQRNQYSARFKTSSIASFEKYVLEQKEENRIYVNSNAMQAECIFDLGTVEEPGHAKHQTVLQLEKTLPYKAVLKAHDQFFSQRELFNFMQDWKHNMVFVDHDGNTEIPADVASQRVLNLDIEESFNTGQSEGDFSASRSRMQSVEAKARDGNRPPSLITFACEPYPEFKSRSFVFRVCIAKSGHDGFGLKLRGEGLDAIQDTVADEFIEKLNSTFSDRVLKGTLSV